MSSREQRLAALSAAVPVAASLEGRLRAAGIPIPDQAQARFTMGRYLLGFDDLVPVWRAKFALYRRVMRRWVPYAYPRYSASERLQKLHGAVPESVKELAARIRAAAPDASLTIKAQRSDDPWLIATTETEEVIIAGWTHTPEGIEILA